ncbi:MAG: FeoB-associated Cys-rich membrane protein [Clostridia bacterium]|nr:FeoB-associated Cys-rich membrane protein [Clostridia bacterium]MBP5429206.1 FeoB-associated Cys-rich membrane protein [Clostridia bacterium]
MFAWIASNWATLLIVLALLGVVAGCIFSILHGRKTGKSACGCNCGHCPMSGACHKK